MHVRLSCEKCWGCEFMTLERVWFYDHAVLRVADLWQSTRLLWRCYDETTILFLSWKLNGATWREYPQGRPRHKLQMFAWMAWVSTWTPVSDSSMDAIRPHFLRAVIIVVFVDWLYVLSMKLLAVDPRGSLCHGIGCLFTVTVVRLRAL